MKTIKQKKTLVSNLDIWEEKKRKEIKLKKKLSCHQELLSSSFFKNDEKVKNKNEKSY